MLYHELYPFGIQVKTIVPGVVKTGFKTEMLMPDMDDLELPKEVAQDIYHAVTDNNSNRMCYVTGKITNELYQK